MPEEQFPDEIRPIVLVEDIEPPVTRSRVPLSTWVILAATVLAVSAAVVLGLNPQWMSFDKFSPTATPLPPTATSSPTPIPTNTPPPTATPFPTSNPFPPSAFAVDDLGEVVPPLPGIAESVVILNDDLNVISNPALSDPPWVPSSEIGLEVQILEPYHATFGSAAVAWVMDVPLEPGLYELYILDTLYSSGGSLDFIVALGNEVLQPIIGQAKVNYKSSYTTPSQSFDLWHSLGIYPIEQAGILSITTTWRERDEYSVVAIDRALIARLPASSSAFLDMLPRSPQTYIVDNWNAKIATRESIYKRGDIPAWGDEFQFLVNPTVATQVSWPFPERIPVGTYQVFAWIPGVSGNAEVSYTVFVEGSAMGREPVSIQQKVSPTGEWILLDTLEIPELYGESVAISIQMDIPEGTSGEVAIDAVALVRTP